MANPLKFVGAMTTKAAQKRMSIGKAAGLLGGGGLAGASYAGALSTPGMADRFDPAVGIGTIVGGAILGAIGGTRLVGKSKKVQRALSRPARAKRRLRASRKARARIGRTELGSNQPMNRIGSTLKRAAGGVRRGANYLWSGGMR